MKIAIIAGKNPYNQKGRDGGPITVMNYVRFLEKRGHFVDVFCSERKEFASNRRYVIRKISYRSRLIKMFVKSLPKNKIEDKYIDKIDLSFLQAEAIVKKFDLNLYDIIYVGHIYNSFGIIENKVADIRKMIISPLMMGNLYKKYQKVNVKYIRMEKKVCKKIRFFEATSRFEKKALIKQGAKSCNIFIHHRGIDDEIFRFKKRKPISKNDTLEILSVNAIRPQKNQFFFFKLLREFEKCGIKARINIVGDIRDCGNDVYDKYKNDFLKKIKTLGFEKKFRIYGQLGQKKINKIAEKMHIAIYPSIYESFGKSILESICMGLPTIAFSGIPEYKEYLIDGENGILAKRDEKFFVAIIKKMMEDKSFYLKLSESGRILRKKYSWKLIGNIVEKSFFHINKKNVG